MLEAATTTWKKKYNTLHVKLGRKEPDPFVVGMRLGGGGAGEVNRTNLGNIPLALKRIYTRDPSEAVETEVKIMQQLAKDRHQHIVQLIGSYQKRLQSGDFELGLLIWPVACCDLARLLLDVDTVGAWIASTDASIPYTTPEREEEEDVLCAIETLVSLESEESEAEDIIRSPSKCRQLYEKVLTRIEKGIRCIAQAVQRLHALQIQHKDLKPSQILLSSEGIWLSDFGWSKDMSDMTHSNTVGGKTTTPKYLAPERASKNPCGRPQDIFSLGCIFLEIGYQLTRPHNTEHLKAFRAPWSSQSWLFSQNISEARDQISMLKACKNDSLRYLGNVIRDMLDPDPTRRPKINEVVASLSDGIGSAPCCVARPLTQSISCPDKIADSALCPNNASNSTVFPSTQTPSSLSRPVESSEDPHAIDMCSKRPRLEGSNESPETTEVESTDCSRPHVSHTEQNWSANWNQGESPFIPWFSDADAIPYNFASISNAPTSPSRACMTDGVNFDENTPWNSLQILDGQHDAALFDLDSQDHLFDWDTAWDQSGSDWFSNSTQAHTELETGHFGHTKSEQDDLSIQADNIKADSNETFEFALSDYTYLETSWPNALLSTAIASDRSSRVRFETADTHSANSVTAPSLIAPIAEYGSSECNVCGIVLTGKYHRSNLRRHKHAKHQNQSHVYVCSEEGCRKTYKRNDARLKHHRMFHKTSEARQRVPPASLATAAE